MLRQRLERMEELARERHRSPRAASPEARTDSNAVKYHIGIDIGDKTSEYCFLDEGANILAQGSLASTREALEAYFSAIPRSRIGLEVGTHSAWMSALLERLGHEVYVGNPRKMGKKVRRNDKLDAEKLARQVRSDPAMLYPIRHRGLEARQDLVLIRARDSLVSARTKLVNCARGLVKSLGGRLPGCSAEAFHKLDVELIPEGIRAAVSPLLEQVGLLTTAIRKYEVQVTRMARQKYPETRVVQQPKGVGDLTSLAFILTLEDPNRFRKSRDVGPYLGLVPGMDESGESSPQLGISHAGDRMVRRLLVGSAQYILGPFGEDCDLRRFGLKVAARGGQKAKKRAVVAVARKLGVLMHRLWLTGEVYEPLRGEVRNLAAETNG
jgi:transposase